MKKSAKTNGWSRRWFVLNEKTGKVSVYHKYPSEVDPNICRSESCVHFNCNCNASSILSLTILNFVLFFLEHLFIICIEVICLCIYLSSAWLYEKARRKKLPRHCNFGGIILLQYLLLSLVEDVTTIKRVIIGFHIYVALPPLVL